MDVCEIWRCVSIINFVTLAYWMCFEAVWLYRIWAVILAPCGRLHVLVACAVVFRLLAKALIAPALSKCRPTSVEFGLAYLANNAAWTVIFCLSLVICRGYGITHWTLPRSTAAYVALGSSGIFLLAFVPVATEETDYELLVYGYSLLVFTCQLYLGVRTMRTLVDIEKFVTAAHDVTQMKPIRQKKQLMGVILLTLFAAYAFEVLFFAFTLANMSFTVLPHQLAIRTAVLTSIEPLINTLIYYQVRPKTQDHDLLYGVEPDSPFRFLAPKTGQLLAGDEFLLSESPDSLATE